jgi:hypothetical protein
MKSPWQQFIHNPDGSITLEGHPGLAIEAIEEQGRATARNIEAELGLPKYFEEWEILAKPADAPTSTSNLYCLTNHRHGFQVSMDSNRNGSPSQTHAT